MTFLTLDKLKKHLNIDATFTADDEYITSLGDVAEAIVSNHLGFDLSELAENNGGSLPAPIVHAMFLFVGNLYMNRESVSVANFSNIPFSYEYLIGLYKNYNDFKG